MSVVKWVQLIDPEIKRVISTEFVPKFFRENANDENAMKALRKIMSKDYSRVIIKSDSLGSMILREAMVEIVYDDGAIISEYLSDFQNKHGQNKMILGLLWGEDREFQMGAKKVRLKKTL